MEIERGVPGLRLRTPSFGNANRTRGGSRQRSGGAVLMPIGECKLCLLTADPQNSHLMPASLYKKSRNPGAANPNPMLITQKGSTQTSRQIRNHVLCRNCEHLFIKNGENYVMTQVFDGKSRKFPLLDALHTSTPSWPGPDSVGYDLAATPAIDRDKLGYFALSVFWRASVHIWRNAERSRLQSIWAGFTMKRSDSTFSARLDSRQTSRCSSSLALIRCRRIRSASLVWGAGISSAPTRSWRRA
jgi:hypothetical protein